MTRKTILLLAYSVSPIRGSEYSVGWNYIKEMSEDNHLIVLYGLAGDHMGDLNEVELSDYCRLLPSVQWVPIRPNFWARVLNTLNRNGFIGFSFYLAYKFWHRQAYRAAKILVESKSIDLIHYLCPIGFREPGYLWKIEKPYIWGPIGGIDNRSVKLVIQRSFISAVKVVLRNAVNSMQFHFSPRVKKGLHRADLLLSSTSRIQTLIKDAYKIESIAMPENAITSDMLLKQRVVTVEPGTSVNLIWVGRVDEAKALDILIRALAPIKTKPWKLNIIGDGPAKSVCINLVSKYELSDKINWTGKIPRQEVNNHYQQAHIHIITSLFEANTTVIWEAMSFGIPTITLDHFGMRDTVCTKCGIKVPLSDSLQAVIDELTQRLSHLIDNPHRIQELSLGVHICSRRFTWLQRREDWNRYYDQAITNWQIKYRAKHRVSKN